MSIYQCDECGCAENTALGWFHCRTMADLVDPKYFGRKLCCVCGPTHFTSGEPIEQMGKWHDRFERKFYPKDSMETDKHGNLVPRTKSSEKDNPNE